MSVLERTAVLFVQTECVRDDSPARGDESGEKRETSTGWSGEPTWIDKFSRNFEFEVNSGTICGSVGGDCMDAGESGEVVN